MRRLDKRSRRMNTGGMKTLKTIPDIVKAFGGKRALAKLVGAKKESTSLICNWIADNYIPPGWHYRLHLAAEHRGFVIEPKALGVEPTGFGRAPQQRVRKAA